MNNEVNENHGGREEFEKIKREWTFASRAEKAETRAKKRQCAENAPQNVLK
jgi:hypothetical protein